MSPFTKFLIFTLAEADQALNSEALATLIAQPEGDKTPRCFSTACNMALAEGFQHGLFTRDKLRQYQPTKAGLEAAQVASSSED
jgi:hypothetical protein